ncbi:hypothetical protein V8C43DRAFT_283555, partial [Trichoderma afarasin]
MEHWEEVRASLWQEERHTYHGLPGCGHLSLSFVFACLDDGGDGYRVIGPVVGFITVQGALAPGFSRASLGIKSHCQRDLVTALYSLIRTQQDQPGIGCETRHGQPS